MLTRGHWERALGVGERACAGAWSLAHLYTGAREGVCVPVLLSHLQSDA